MLRCFRVAVTILLFCTCSSGVRAGLTSPGAFSAIRFNETDSLPSDRFIDLYGNLDNFFLRIKDEKRVRVVFLGGSITAGKGWREKVMQYLEVKYPSTEWTFTNAGIPSLGSVPHAFRFERDVLAGERVDLLFVESAVNDLANGTPVIHQRRALEGIVRHALSANPSMNIVLMAFVDEMKIGEYRSGRTPTEVGVHQEIASYYRIPFINLAKEVTQRIEANEFSWERDFVDLHPSPFGHQIYYRTIRRLLERCAAQAWTSKIIPSVLSLPIDKFSYSSGTYVQLQKAGKLKDFDLVQSWKPADDTPTRSGFVDVPMLVAERPGSSFELSFNGNAVGIAIISGPDAGAIRYSIDGGQEKTVDLFTQWSHMLHLPWYIMLQDGLKSGKHKLEVTLIGSADARSTGTACRVVHFLVNK